MDLFENTISIVFFQIEIISWIKKVSQKLNAFVDNFVLISTCFFFLWSCWIILPLACIVSGVIKKLLLDRVQRTKNMGNTSTKCKQEWSRWYHIICCNQTTIFEKYLLKMMLLFHTVSWNLLNKAFLTVTCQALIVKCNSNVQAGVVQ